MLSKKFENVSAFFPLVLIVMVMTTDLHGILIVCNDV